MDETKNETQKQTAQIIVRTIEYVEILPMMMIIKILCIFVYCSSSDVTIEQE